MLYFQACLYKVGKKKNLVDQNLRGGGGGGYACYAFFFSFFFC